MTEAYLGDVIGSPLVAMHRTRTHRTAPRWIERGVHVALGWTAFAVYGGMIAAHLVMLFWAFPPHWVD